MRQTLLRAAAFGATLCVVAVVAVLAGVPTSAHGRALRLVDFVHRNMVNALQMPSAAHEYHQLFVATREATLEQRRASRGEASAAQTPPAVRAGKPPSVAAGFNQQNGSGSFTIYSMPIRTRYGQVWGYDFENDIAQYGTMPLPAEIIARYADNRTRSMAVSGFSLDFVRIADDGSETSIPTHELYDHHHFVNFLGPGEEYLMNFGSSFEYRHTPFHYEAPYRRVVSRPQSYYPFMHLINTRQPGVAYSGQQSPLTQCPCTGISRHLPPGCELDGTCGVDGNADFGVCPPWLAGNPSCEARTYVGGIRCCSRKGHFLDDTSACATPACTERPLDTAYLKMTFHIEDAKPAVRPIAELMCCDLPTAYGQPGDEFGISNMEFDVEPHPSGVRRYEAVLALDAHTRPGIDDGHGSSTELVELAYALPHVHEGGYSIELQDGATNRTLCHASIDNGGIVVGHGSEAGDEAGMITGFRTCTWSAGSAPLYPRGHPMRVIAHYHATAPITGAMARMVLAGHHVDVAAREKARHRVRAHHVRKGGMAHF